MNEIDLIKALLAYLLIALGSALTIKAALGVGSFMALTVALSDLSGFSVGTLLILLEIFFFVFCLVLDPNARLREYILMLIAVCFSGVTTDLALAVILKDLVLDSYILRLLSFFSGLFLLGFGNGRVLHYGILTFPLEKWCLLMATKTCYTFKTYRYGIDVFCICSALLLTWAYSSPVVIREGTVISILCLAGIITWSSQLYSITERRS